MSKQDVADYVFKTPLNTNPAILNQKLDELIKEGGGGVQSDWNQNDNTQPDYVKNRPFYTGDPVETVLVEESTTTFVESDGLYIAEFPSTFEATVGETYKVYWDGAAYECTCVNTGNKGYAIGNLSILGGNSDTGEPFVMGIKNGAGILIVTTDTSASHTFSISRFVQEVVKIDEKYLPDTLATKVEAAQTTAEAAQTTAEAALPIAGGKMAGDIIMKKGFGIRADEVNTLKMSINREVTKPDFYIEKDGTNRNNEMYLKAGFTNNDSAASYVSLGFTRNFNTTTLTLPTGSSTSTIPAVLKLVGTNKKAVTLDQVGMIVFREPDDNAKYYHLKSDENDSLVAENFNGIIINSSTPGSTKKFKITVDDNGTISATEVT